MYVHVLHIEELMPHVNVAEQLYPASDLIRVF